MTPGYDSWKTRSPDGDVASPEEPSHEQQRANWEDEQQQAVKLRCEMCFDSKWKSACPECDGTGYYTPEGK